VVTMAIGFVGMLVRKKAGTELAGIDLPGFVRQVDEVIAEAIAAPELPLAATPSSATSAMIGDRLTDETRTRLARIATESFLESVATGHQRPRVERTWCALVAELSAFESVRLDVRMSRHVQASRALAADLGKAVDIELRLGGVEVSRRIADAIDEALLHVLRNAIDHGIERPEQRLRAGKSARGALSIRAEIVGAELQIEVADDGGGIDVEAVRWRAAERGLVDASTAAGLGGEQLLEVLFAPGFSTRASASELSGRGMGMDAARDALAGQGGRVSVTSSPARGTVVTMRVPQHDAPVPVLQFPIPSGARVAVPASWEAREASSAADALDIGAHLDLPAAYGAASLRVALVRGGDRCVVLAGAWPVPATAQRMCRTPDEYPVEIIRFEDGWGLLAHDTLLRDGPP
jgi:two-component system chemotaxis sensor kinase CheA